MSFKILPFALITKILYLIGISATFHTGSFNKGFAIWFGRKLGFIAFQIWGLQCDFSIVPFKVWIHQFRKDN